VTRPLRSALAALVAALALGFAATAQASPPTVSFTVVPPPESAAPSATFVFASSSASATLECRVDSGEFTPCVSPVTLNGLPLGGHAFEVRAVDPTEGTGAAVTFSWTVLPAPVIVASLRPPPIPQNVHVVAGDRLVRLTWNKPAASGREVIVKAAAGNTPPRVVFRGSGTGTTLLGLRNGVALRLTLKTIDRIGNESREVVLDATPMPPFVGLPSNRARVTSPPLLRWNALEGADYFNVQLFRGSHKLLSAWPVATRLQLARGWIYDGRWQTLRPGVYTWYVWPGLGSRAAAQYAPLLGKQTFVVS
jgi:hypothetical protein